MAKILIVEDERIVAKDLELTIRAIGHEVTGTAATGLEALEKASADPPELVMMDVHLRGEIDGIETARRMRESIPVPIVFLTAFGDPETVARASAIGAHGYLLKPFKEDDLRAAIEIALYKHRLDEQLRENERWLATTLKSVGDGVIATDAFGSVQLINPVAQELTGWTETEALGRSLESVLRLVRGTDRSPMPPLLERVRREGRSVRLESDVLLLSRNGTEIAIDDSIAPILDDRGQLAGVIVALRDVRQRREFEARAAMEGRLASLGTLTAGIAHEINNPLSAILTNAHAIRADLASLDDGLTLEEPIEQLRSRLREIDSALSDIASGATRVADIVRGVRTFARADGPKRSSLDLRTPVAAAVRLSGHEVRPRARLELELESAPLVLAHAGQLEQVVMNLVINAAQAIPEGAASEHVVRVRTCAEDGGAVIEVHDTGSGIPPALMVRIFEPFFTTKPVGSGMGLGLPICHGIVRAHGGRIEVRSEPGAGSTFRVWLPAADAKPASASSSPPRSAAADAANRALAGARRLRVLVVDDDPLVLRAIARVLRTHHDVVAATSGSAALEQLEAGECFDVVISDLSMPELTGPQLHAQVIASWPELAPRMLFLSGGTFTPDGERFARELGGRVLTKPVERELLLRSVAEVHSSAPPRRA